MENESQGLAETPKVEPVQPVEPFPASATSPVISPVPEAPKKSNKKLFLIVGIIILVLVLVAGGIGAYFLMKGQSEVSPTPVPTVEPTPTADPMAGWKSGNLADLSFKYPENWELNVINQDQQYEIRPIGEEFPALVMYTVENPEKLSLKEFGGDWEIKPAFYSLEAETIMVSGVAGYYQAQQHCEPRTCDKYAVAYKDKVYATSFAYESFEVDALQAEFKKFNPLFRSVINSFEFSESSGLNVYRNTTYGYSINFPKTWEAYNVTAGGGTSEALAGSLIVDISDTTQTSRPYPNGVITIQGFDTMPSYDSSWTKSLTNINYAAVTIFEKADAQDGPSTAYIFQSSPGAKYIEVLFRSSKQDSIYKTFGEIVSTFKFTQ